MAWDVFGFQCFMLQLNRVGNRFARSDSAQRFYIHTYHSNRTMRRIRITQSKRRPERVESHEGVARKARRRSVPVEGLAAIHAGHQPAQVRQTNRPFLIKRRHNPNKSPSWVRQQVPKRVWAPTGWPRQAGLSSTYPSKSSPLSVKHKASAGDQ